MWIYLIFNSSKFYNGMNYCNYLTNLLLMDMNFAFQCFSITISAIRQVSPNSRPWTGTGPWPVSKQAAHQEVSGSNPAKLHLYF